MLKVQKLICLILVIVMLLPNIAIGSESEKYTLSGQVSLPDGIISPRGGLEGEIYLDDDKTTKLLFNIPEGKTSANFSFTAPTGYCSLSYKLLTPSDNIFEIGYYFYKSGNIEKETAIYVNSDITNINFKLIRKVEFTAIITLPLDEVAPEQGAEGNISITESVYFHGYFWPAFYNIDPISFKIDAGKNSVSKSVYVPEGNYSINYDISSLSDKYIGYGFLLDNNSTSAYARKKNNINISSTNNEFNIPILKGNVISGKIKLPQNDDDELFIEIRSVVTDIYCENKFVAIDYISLNRYGQKDSDKFKFIVPDGHAILKTEIMGSELKPCRYINCYYNKPESVPFEDEAYIFNVKDNNIENIEFKMLEGTRISGNMLIPEESCIDSINPFSVSALVYCEGSYSKKYYSSLLSINNDKTTCPFEVYVPKGKLILKYEFAISEIASSDTNLNHSAYYSEPDSTLIKSNASVIDSCYGPVENINFKFLPYSITDTNTSTITPTKTIGITPNPIEKKKSSKGSYTALVTPTPTIQSKMDSTNSSAQKEVPSFKDIKDHWSQSYIQSLIEKKILSGYEDGSFRPDSPVSRAEFIVMLSRALELKLPRNPDTTFSDNNIIPEWAKAYIKAAFENKLLNGYEDNSFKPDKELTREEISVFVGKASNTNPVQDEKTSFIDYADISSWSKGYIKQAVDLGILCGYPGGEFKPQSFITRGEVAVVINKLLDYLKK